MLRDAQLAWDPNIKRIYISCESGGDGKGLEPQPA